MVFQLYFREQSMPMLSSWLGMQVQKKADCIGGITAYLLAGGLDEEFVKGKCLLRKESRRYWRHFLYEQYSHCQVNDFLELDS